MFFKTKQLELADRASFLSVIYDEIAPIQVGCQFFFQNGSGNNFNKHRDNNTGY
jgi:hypothetical protein